MKTVLLERGRIARIFLVLACLAGTSQPALADKNTSNNPTNTEILILEAIVAFNNEASWSDCVAPHDLITITGVKFDNGDPPSVIGGQGPLMLCDYR